MHRRPLDACPTQWCPRGALRREAPRRQTQAGPPGPSVQHRVAQQCQLAEATCSAEEAEASLRPLIAAEVLLLPSVVAEAQLRLLLEEEGVSPRRHPLLPHVPARKTRNKTMKATRAVAGMKRRPQTQATLVGLCLRAHLAGQAALRLCPRPPPQLDRRLRLQREEALGHSLLRRPCRLLLRHRQWRAVRPVHPAATSRCSMISTACSPRYWARTRLQSAGGRCGHASR